MSRILLSTALVAAVSLSAGAALAQTPKDGTTLAGGNNGANAKADATMKAGEAQHPKGTPDAPVAHGQGTEHVDGKMRGQKEF